MSDLEGMTCLSLWQPWATLFASGAKRVETRSWPIKHRGPLLIHAAKHWNSDSAMLCASLPFRQCLESAGIVMVPTTSAAKAGWNLPFGAIIGRVEVVDCLEAESHLPWISADEREFGDYRPGRFAFLCENPVMFERPIPCRGLQGLFKFKGAK